jgi:enoyl-CoA hydratase/carnithine racemase
VRSVHPPDELRRRRALATEIAENTAPVSVALSRLMMWRMLGADHRWKRPRRLAPFSLVVVATTREGRNRSFEKRPPEFLM